MVNEPIYLKGKIHLILKDENGITKQEFEKDNLVVQAGKNYVASAMIINATTPFISMAVGTGTASPTSGDTALQAEVNRQLFQSTSQTASAVTMIGFYGAGVATAALTEAGIFNNATTGGTMLSRIVFAAVNKAASDTLTITWTVTLS